MAGGQRPGGQRPGVTAGRDREDSPSVLRGSLRCPAYPTIPSCPRNPREFLSLRYKPQSVAISSHQAQETVEFLGAEGVELRT